MFFLEIFPKIFKIFIFNTSIVSWNIIIKTFYIVMHRGSRGGGFVAIFIPHGLNFFFCHWFISGLVPIFCILFFVVPFFTIHHHIIDNFIGIKYRKMMMVPCSNGRISKFSMNSVYMWSFIKFYIFITAVFVLLC